MSKLEECILGDLVEFQRGYDLPKSKFVEGKYPVQSSNGILGYHNEYKVEGPGITIGRSGTVGNPHLIRENFFPHNTSLFVKEFKGNDIEYIYYLLQYLDLGNQKSGSGVPTMNRNHLHPIKIRAYRDKTCQQRTIKILSLIDKKSKSTTKSTKSWKPWLRPSMTTGLCSLISQTRMANPTNHQAERWSITQSSNAKSQRDGE